LLPIAVSLLLLEALFMQISGVSLTLTWPCRLCLLRVLLCASPCYKLSPFQAHWGRYLHLFSLACMFIYTSWEVGLSPSTGNFLPTASFISFPTPDCWAVLLLLPATVFVYSSRGGGSSPVSCGVFLPPPLSRAFPLLVAGCVHSFPLEPLWPGLACLFTVPGRIPLPYSLALSVPPSLPLVFIVLIAYYSVSLFSPGEGQSVQGAMLFCPRVVCGSTVYHLAHLVYVFPSCLGTGDWWPWSPAGFSV
jgi:hypothetical protein